MVDLVRRKVLKVLKVLTEDQPFLRYSKQMDDVFFAETMFTFTWHLS
jgi:hypothetical protein